jgi:hypothetical protein
MDTRDLRRIQFVTRRFNELQGLRQGVGGGLLLVAQGVGLASHGWLKLFLQVAIQVGALLLMFRMKSYYRHRFGEVEVQAKAPLWLRGRRGVALLALALILPVAVIMIAAFAGAPLPTVSQVTLGRLCSLVIGVGAIALWMRQGSHSFRAYYLALGALLIFLAAPGPSSDLVFSPAGSGGVGWCVLGACFMLAGWFDHRLLVRTLGPPAAGSRKWVDETEPEAER